MSKTLLKQSNKQPNYLSFYEIVNITAKGAINKSVECKIYNNNFMYQNKIRTKMQ